MKRIALATAFCLALVAAPATAQVSVYGGGGAAFPSGDDLSNVDAGLQLLGGVTFDVNERLSIYGEGQWGRHNPETGDGTITPTALMAGLLLGLTADDAAPVSPYIFAGGGLQGVDIDDGAGNSVDDRTFGWQAGAGVGFALGGLDAFAEGRYQSAAFDTDSDLSDLDFAIFSIVVGFSIDVGGS
jgi:opacity protein-like surface antigen